MCSWYANSSNDERRGRGKSKQRTHHYFWDLDDGRPGFVRQTKRDRLKLFVDSDGDGLFTKKMNWWAVPGLKKVIEVWAWVN